MNPDEILGTLKIMLWVQLAATPADGGKTLTLLKKRMTEAEARVAVAEFIKVNPDLQKLDVWAEWQLDPIGVALVHLGE